MGNGLNALWTFTMLLNRGHFGIVVKVARDKVNCYQISRQNRSEKVISFGTVVMYFATAPDCWRFGVHQTEQTTQR